MTDEQLAAFLAVVELGSLTRAATRLREPQATVSDRLRALERELRTPLVRKKGRGVEATPAGLAAVPALRRALAALTAGRDAARGAATGVRGRIRLATSVTAGALFAGEAIARFRRRYGDVEVLVRSVHTEDAAAALLDGEADLAITSGPLLHPRIERLHRARHPLVLVAAPSHPLAARGAATPEGLRGTTFHLLAWGPAWRRFVADLEGEGPTPAGWTAVSPVELVKGLVLAGIGVAGMPERSARREIAEGRLAVLAIAGRPTPAWSVELARRRGPAPGAVESAFIAELARAIDSRR
jgi:DNA-binding transcriptional LysR family regulator